MITDVNRNFGTIGNKSIRLTLSKVLQRILAPVQPVSRMPLSVAACVRSQENTCGICVRQGDTGACFTPDTLISPC
jgi:hypothetical protein